MIREPTPRDMGRPAVTSACAAIGGILEGVSGMLDWGPFKPLIEVVATTADRSLERAAEKRLKRETDSPLATQYEGWLRGIRRTAREESNSGKRPVVLIAPLGGDGVSEWQHAVRRAFEQSAWGQDAGVITGHLEGAVTKDDIHVGVIHRLLRRVPTILVYGSVEDGRVRLRIATWNVRAGKPRRKAGPVAKIRLPAMPLGAGRVSVGETARTAAVHCAKVAECFHVARGRRPTAFLEPGPDAVERAADVLAALSAGYQGGGFKPFEACRADPHEATCDECLFLSDLGGGTRRAQVSVRDFAYHAYAATVEAYLGHSGQLRAHADAALAAAGQGVGLRVRAQGLVVDAAERAAQVSPQQNDQLHLQLSVLRVVYETARNKFLLGGLDG